MNCTGSAQPSEPTATHGRPHGSPLQAGAPDETTGNQQPHGRPHEVYALEIASQLI